MRLLACKTSAALAEKVESSAECVDRVRTLRLSLAAKCEMLFGIAICLVIAAAIFLPWHRMEQLTAQLNERAAEAVIQAAVDQHVAYWTARMPGRSGRR